MAGVLVLLTTRRLGSLEDPLLAASHAPAISAEGERLLATRFAAVRAAQ